MTDDEGQARLKSKLRKILVTGIFIVSVTIVGYSMYSEPGAVWRTPNAIDTRYRPPAQITETSLKTLDTFNTSHLINRPSITKSEYPITVYAPFVIENPRICDGNVTLLIAVKSAANHFYKRSLIRQSFGNVNLFTRQYNVRVVFTLGVSTDHSSRETIKLENSLYHDLVQGEFMDTYRNLTLKGVMAYRWISLHCSHAELVLTMDDDFFVNVFNLLEKYLPVLRGQKELILCNVMWPSPIIRSVNSPRVAKWKVDEDFFRGQRYFPPYCSGFSVFMSADVPRVLWKAAYFTPFFWVDDVYLTGLLPSQFGIPLTPLNEYLSCKPKSCFEEYKTNDPKYVSCVAKYDKEFWYFWKRTLAIMSPSMRQIVNETFLTETLEERNNKLDWLRIWM